jgi:hypothetical protein
MLAYKSCGRANEMGTFTYTGSMYTYKRNRTLSYTTTITQIYVGLLFDSDVRMFDVDMNEQKVLCLRAAPSPRVLCAI